MYLRVSRALTKRSSPLIIRTKDVRKLAQCDRFFSDSLIGYNPMATQSSINKNVKKVEVQGISPIGVDSNTEGGGIWAQTNAKREKLGELRLELKQERGEFTFDDAATAEEKKDLYLIDGILSVCSLVDGKDFLNLSSYNRELSHLSSLQAFYTYLDEYIKSIHKENGDGESTLQINRHQFENHINDLLKYIDQNIVLREPALVNLRNFLLFKPPNEEYSILPSKLQSELAADFVILECEEHLRILQLKACLKHLLKQWDTIVKISGADIDRAATMGITIEQPSSVSTIKLHAVIRSFGSGSCVDRIQALWKLLDKDDDGLLNQAEMDSVAFMSLVPVENAFKDFVRVAVECWPLRGDMPFEISDKNALKEILNWFKRRQVTALESRAKKDFLKLTEKALKRHFEADVEMSHRLRCTYAWADKKHQNGRVESVTISDEGTAGKQRYVELDPKISYEEFRDQQLQHFRQLDRVAEELSIGLKEEFWIMQGKRRQREVLKKESLAFLTLVAAIDVAIYLN